MDSPTDTGAVRSGSLAVAMGAPARQDVAGVRPATLADMADVAAIYGIYALTGTATFEEQAPDTAEMQRRFEAIAGQSLPYLVAVEGGRVCGFAYAALFRQRSAYRFTVEDSIYIHPECTGRGLGRRLLADLVTRSEALGLRQMVAVIGDSDNRASIGLHASLGFAAAGQLASVGFKFGRWLDVVFMTRPLGSGDCTVPATDRPRS